MKRNSLLILITAFICAIPLLGASATEKPRIIITADPECDDNNSMIHFLLRSYDFNIQGLVYASSRYHWKGNGTGECRHVSQSSNFIKDFGYRDNWRWSEGFIEQAIDAYAQCYDNLKVHHEGYPDPEYLKTTVRYGNIDFEGDYSHDTPGSDLIKQCILDDEPGPLYVTVWGGASTVARALKSIEEQYGQESNWAEIRAKVVSKLVIWMGLDQDGSYPCYILPCWPDVHVLKNGYTPLRMGYYSQLVVAPEVEFYYEPEWWAENIWEKGVMGSITRVWGDGKSLVPNDMCDCFGEPDKTLDELKELGYVDCYFDTRPKGSFLAEGSYNSFLNLIDNGLRAIEDETWGGWLGRSKRAEKDITAVFNPIKTGNEDPAYENFNIVPAYMHALATHYTWSMTPNYADANHDPVISDAPLALTAKAGETVKIKATVSDPDGNNVSCEWWQFKVGTYPGDVTLADTEKTTVKVTIPEDAETGDTIHIILSATDDAELPLTRYHRVVITVE